MNTKGIYFGLGKESEIISLSGGDKTKIAPLREEDIKKFNPGVIYDFQGDSKRATGTNIVKSRDDVKL